MSNGRWIGVDLDGTLARYDGWKDGAIGEPIPAMVVRVKQWLAEGREVRIFTARVSGGPLHTEEAARQREMIQDWCQKHLGRRLQVTCRKDFACDFYVDDRARQVEANTGRIIGEEIG